MKELTSFWNMSRAMQNPKCDISDIIKYVDAPMTLKFAVMGCSDMIKAEKQLYKKILTQTASHGLGQNLSKKVIENEEETA